MLVGWFRDAAEQTDGDYWKCCGMGACPNRKGPFWGIFEEYPICDFQRDGQPVWDEDDWWEHKEFAARGGPKGLIVDEYEWEGTSCKCKWMPRPPTRDELITIGLAPRAILDIACTHKGNVLFGVEIVHKHPIPPQKAVFLETCGFPIFEVKASWLLSQVSIPKRMVVDRIFGDRLFLQNYDFEYWRGNAA